MRNFHLVRNEDVSGVSGTGIVAEGVEFSNGSCVMHWLSKLGSIAIYDKAADIEIIHGHEGRTKVVYVE